MFFNLAYGTKQYIVICASLIVAAAIAFVSTPFAIRFAKKIGAVDIPKDNRRMHDHPIPLLGGLAIITGFIVTSIVMMRYHRLLIEILPGALIIALMGIFDDRFKMKAWPKFFIQCIAACLPLIANKNLIITSVSGFDIFGIKDINFGVMSIPITIIWIVGITNAMNLIDGLDGLTAGVTSISSVSMLLIAIIKMKADSSEYGITVLTAALAGSCLGYLPFNKNPAKVFMGDTGSTFLGYVLGVISISGLFKSYAAISVAVPLLVLGIPILDTASAFIRRIFNGKSPFTPDRSHLHHKLIDLGLDQKQTVAILYMVNAMLGLIAVSFAEFGASVGWKFFAVGIIITAASSFAVILLCKRHNEAAQKNKPAESPAKPADRHGENKPGR